MKKIYLIILSACFSLTAMAQKTMPVVKAGTSVTMDVDFHGQAIGLNVVYKSLGDPITISWDVSGTGGTYTMKAKALENGKLFNTEQPQPDGITALGDDETFLCISKSAYQSLKKNKSFIYGGLTFVAKDNGDFKIGTQTMDATYVTTADGKTTAWIANNPDYPLVLTMKGNPSGVDYTTIEIK